MSEAVRSDVPLKPGVYKDLPFETYLAINAVSNTRLGQLAKSPLHYKKNVGLDEKAKYLLLGQLVHAGRLEVTSLALRYAVMPNYHLDDDNCTASGKPSDSKATGYVKEKTALFEEANRDKVVVPREWFEEMQAIVASLVANEAAFRLLSGKGDVELTLIWEDDETGLLCKGRIDRTIPSQQAIVDLKTTADLVAFPRAIGRYGYHRQLAHYRAGWAAHNGGELWQPWIIATEKEPPYCCMTAPLSDDAIEQGAKVRRQLLRKLADCIDADDWPGPESPSNWRLPEWAYQADEELTLNIEGQEFAL